MITNITSINTARPVVGECCSLLTMIKHSELEGFVDGDGNVEIDASTIRDSLVIVCRQIESVFTLLEGISDDLKRSGGAA